MIIVIGFGKICQLSTDKNLEIHNSIIKSKISWEGLKAADFQLWNSYRAALYNTLLAEIPTIFDNFLSTSQAQSSQELWVVGNHKMADYT